MLSIPTVRLIKEEHKRKAEGAVHPAESLSFEESPFCHFTVTFISTDVSGFLAQETLTVMCGSDYVTCSHLI